MHGSIFEVLPYTLSFLLLLWKYMCFHFLHLYFFLGNLIKFLQENMLSTETSTNLFTLVMAHMVHTQIHTHSPSGPVCSTELSFMVAILNTSSSGSGSRGWSDPCWWKIDTSSFVYTCTQSPPSKWCFLRCKLCSAKCCCAFSQDHLWHCNREDSYNVKHGNIIFYRCIFGHICKSVLVVRIALTQLST